MAASPQSFVDLPGIKKLRSGKVREVFDVGERLLFVATDRLSAFDVILPEPIPQKGAVLNQLSAFWNRLRQNDEKGGKAIGGDEEESRSPPCVARDRRGGPRRSG